MNVFAVSPDRKTKLGNWDVRGCDKIFFSDISDRGIRNEVQGFADFQNNGEAYIGDKGMLEEFINDINWNKEPLLLQELNAALGDPLLDDWEFFINYY